MTRKTSPALAAYRRLVKAKSALCKGKGTKTKVKQAAAAYVKATVKAGNKTTAEAKKSASKVVNKGCSLTAKKAKAAAKTTKKRRTTGAKTAAKRRTTTTAKTRRTTAAKRRTMYGRPRRRRAA